ncbi:hypothetical protein RJ641_035726 [Dillenia turbinata]|uniref:Uncharacterized protein n=1 Tax=Dillenia turbinata TaxID=194707 RepID=A0AAN8VT55_9MAGN
MESRQKWSVKLYDECEKLLEIRKLKNDEIIRSGETIQFNTYPVDIGDPKGDHKPIPDQDRKNDRWRSEASVFTSMPSPSQKLIRGLFDCFFL